MSWLSPQALVGGPGPVSPATPSGPLSSATVNAYLQPIAAAESKAEAATAAAEALAHQAAAAHEGYAAAFSKLQEAITAWRGVQRLADKLIDAADQQATPEKTEAMHQAKVAAPGIIASAHAALLHLVGLRGELAADQAAKRPDLSPATETDPYADSGLPWGGLAIAAGIVYLLWKAVF